MVDVHEVLAAMLASRPGRPRHEPLWRVDEDRDELVSALQAVRRDGPGRLRAVALDALVYLAGPSALDPADLAAVERLIAVRQHSDPLAAVMSCWTYWWCVRSDHHAAVIASLGLTGARPATYTLACSLIDILEHDERDSGVVYVGPAQPIFGRLLGSAGSPVRDGGERGAAWLRSRGRWSPSRAPSWTRSRRRSGG